MVKQRWEDEFGTSLTHLPTMQASRSSRFKSRRLSSIQVRKRKGFLEPQGIVDLVHEDISEEEDRDKEKAQESIP